MPRRATVAVLGGTFDHFHAGHRDLIDAAFGLADRVGIGVTTDAYLRKHPKPLGGRLETYRRRRAEVSRFLESRYPRGRWWIGPLEDGWGRSVEAGVDTLVVSEETAVSAKAVNRERTRRRLPPLRIVAVPLHQGQDLIPVSSRAVRAGLIDPTGRRRRRIRVAISNVPRDGALAIRRSFRNVFGAELVRGVRSRRRVTPTAGRRMPPWDYLIETAGPRRPSRVLRITDRSGHSADVTSADRSPEALGIALGNYLNGRRKPFSVPRGR